MTTDDDGPPDTLRPSALPPAPQSLSPDMANFISLIADAVGQRIKAQIDELAEEMRSGQREQDINHEILRRSHRKLRERVRALEQWKAEGTQDTLPPGRS